MLALKEAIAEIDRERLEFSVENEAAELLLSCDDLRQQDRGCIGNVRERVWLIDAGREAFIVGWLDDCRAFQSSRCTGRDMFDIAPTIRTRQAKSQSSGGSTRARPNAAAMVGARRASPYMTGS